MEILFYLVLLSGANIQCFAELIDDCPLAKACYVHYLHGKGKLDEPLPSTVQSPSRCRFAIAFFSSVFADYLVEPFAPEAADCLKNQTEIGEFLDYGLKHHLYDSYLSDDTDRFTVMEETIRNLLDLEIQIRLKCNINETGADKNPTLEDHQLKYCMVKYAMDNQLLELSDDFDVNPHRIDTETVNCTDIITSERNKAETKFRDQTSGGDCAINEFRNGAIFDWKVAKFVLKGFYLPSENHRIERKIEEYLGQPSSECVV